MARIGAYTQSPGSNDLYSIDYSDWLDLVAGEVLASIAASWSPLFAGPPAFDVAPTYLSADKLTGLFNVTGGEAGVEYAVTILATSTTGRKREDCVIFNIEEPCNG